MSKDYGYYYYNENVEITQLLNHNFSNLDEEIEVIEEDKPIEYISFDVNYWGKLMEQDDIFNIFISGLTSKMNEVIKEVNKMKEGKE